MTREVCFITHPESHGELRDDWLFTKQVVPFALRRKLYEDEKKWNKEADWHDFCGDKHPCIQSEMKPIAVHMYHFIERIEKQVEKLIPYDYQDLRLLSFTFAYHARWYETEHAINSTMPLWYVTVKDKDGDCVHKNWTTFIDTEGSLTITRNLSSFKNNLNHWKFPERRLIDAILSHMRLKLFRAMRQNKNNKVE